MAIFELKLTPAEVVNLLRSETQAAFGAPELAIAAEKEYLIEEEFDSTMDEFVGFILGSTFTLPIGLFTEPFDVAVVQAAQVGPAPGPKDRKSVV